MESADKTADKNTVPVLVQFSGGNSAAELLDYLIGVAEETIGAQVWRALFVELRRGIVAKEVANEDFCEADCESIIESFPIGGKVKRTFGSASSEKTAHRLGVVVAHSFTRGFPLVLVQWDGNKKPTRLHCKFLKVVGSQNPAQ